MFVIQLKVHIHVHSYITSPALTVAILRGSPRSAKHGTVGDLVRRGRLPTVDLEVDLHQEIPFVCAVVVRLTLNIHHDANVVVHGKAQYRSFVPIGCLA